MNLADGLTFRRTWDDLSTFKTTMCTRPWGTHHDSILQDYNNRSYGSLTTYMSLEESTPRVEKYGDTVSLSIQARTLKSEKCPNNDCKIVVADLKRSDVYLLIVGLIEALSKSDIKEGQQLDANAEGPVHYSILDLMVKNFDSLTSPCCSSKIPWLLIELAQVLNKNQQQCHLILDQAGDDDGDDMSPEEMAIIWANIRDRWMS